MDETQITKFNRSFTRSEPNLLNCRQVSVTEYFHQPGTDQPLIRQYSYRELHGNPGEFAQFKDERLTSAVQGLNHFQDNFVFKHPENFVNLQTNIRSHDDLDFPDDSRLEEIMQGHNYSPMDIDQSEEHMDVSLKENVWSGKRLHIKSPENIKQDELEEHVEDVKPSLMIDKKQTSGLRISFIHITLGLCFSAVAAFLFFNSSSTLLDSSIVDMQKDLKSQVFNQNHIIDSLIINLNKIHTHTDFRKVLVLVGGTGVGKTHLLNCMKTKYSNDVFISLNYLVDKHIIEGKKNISLPKQCFILAIDDLKMENVSVVEVYIKSIHHTCVLIIPVFNIQETNDGLNHIVRYDHSKQIAQFYDKKFASSETLLFNTMTSKHLEMWIKTVIEKRGLSIQEHSDFIASLLESHDVDNYGFKGVMSKINLLN